MALQYNDETFMSEPGLTVVHIAFSLLAVQRHDVTNTQELAHHCSINVTAAAADDDDDVISHAASHDRAITVELTIAF